MLNHKMHLMRCEAPTAGRQAADSVNIVWTDMKGCVLVVNL